MDETVGGNTGGSESGSVGASNPTLTFADAFQQAPVDSPSTEPVQQDTTPPAAAQPGSASTETPQQADERSPFIPRPRFDEVNAEKNALKTQFEQYKQQTAWAENQVLREAASRVAAHAGNPMGLLSEIVQDLARTPEGAQQLRTFLGQQFGGLRNRQPATPQMPEPDVVITDGNGHAVGRTYSDTALAQRDAIRDQQLFDKITQSFAPKLQTLDQMQAEREQAAADRQASQFADTFFSEVKTWPHYTEDMGKAIAEELKTNRLSDTAHPAEVNAATYKAYLKILARDVLPTLGAKAQSAMLDSLQQKATASTAVNPASSAPTSRSAIKGFHDPALTW